MKLQFLPADASGRIDAVLHDRLWNHVPNFVNENSDVTIVGVSYFSDFVVNQELYKLRGKKWILVDTMEFYSQWPDGKSHLFGISDTPAFGGNDQWKAFGLFVKENPPILQFVRELYKDDVSKFIQPIEWPTPPEIKNWELEPKHNFDTRPFEYFFNFGFSHCSRVKFHGDAFRGWCQEKMEVISSFDHIDSKINEARKKCISIHSPHTHRVNINEIMRRQSQAKIVVSLRGAGIKCFRSTEILHAVPAIHSPNLAWAFDWQDRYNCIHLTEGREYIELLEALELANLHEIYSNARSSMENYMSQNYWERHVRPSIEKVL